MMLIGNGCAMKCLLLVLCLILLMHGVSCRGGKSRSRSSSTSQRQPKQNKRPSTSNNRPSTSNNRPSTSNNRPSTSNNRPTTYRKPPYKPKRKNLFNKGGIKTLGKIALATYIAQKMTPKIRFRQYGGRDGSRRAKYCFKCMSINGSNPACEAGYSTTLQVPLSRKCFPSMLRPYCSVEHGLMSENVSYVTRGCSKTKCDSCSMQLRNLNGNETLKCYPLQCEMCKQSYCNKERADEVFHGDWSGCDEDRGLNSSTEFGERCGASTAQANIFAASFFSLVMLYVSSR